MWFTIYLAAWYAIAVLACVFVAVADLKVVVKPSTAVWNTFFLLGYISLLLFVFSPLTWFGWFLVGYFGLSILTNIVTVAVGGYTAPRWVIIVSGISSAVLFTLLLTVGISA